MFPRFTSLTSPATIPFSDPYRGYLAHADEIGTAIARVLQNGVYILGDEVVAFESEFATYIGSHEAVGVASGTDGIALALRSLGIGPGDEVITVSHTAVATVSGIEQSGATAVVIDIDPRTMTMDPNALPEVLTARTRAVLPVHLYGHPSDLERIRTFCANHSLALVEDASQAHGAQIRGRKVGSLGDAAVFSCYPTKNLGALGDAGIVTFSSTDVADRARRLRQYGWQSRNDSIEPGVNTRLDELQAAILRVKLRYLDAENAMRKRIANTYSKALAATGLNLPVEVENCDPSYHLYVIRHPERDLFKDRLSARGVGTGVHYPRPVHSQSAYQGRLRTGTSMAVTDAVASEVLSLPIFPYLTDEDRDRVVSVCLEVAAEMSATDPHLTKDARS